VDVSAQLLILRVFRWVAVFTIIVTINAAGLKAYGEWERYDGKIELHHVAWVVENTCFMILLAGLVWITSTAAEKYLRTPIAGGGTPGKS
jgi:hypothetical protein